MSGVRQRSEKAGPGNPGAGRTSGQPQSKKKTGVIIGIAVFVIVVVIAAAAVLLLRSLLKDDGIGENDRSGNVWESQSNGEDGNGANKPNEIYTYEYEYDEYGNKTENHEYSLSESNVDTSYIKANGEHSYYSYENEYDDQNRLVTSYMWIRILKNEEKDLPYYSAKYVYEYDTDGDLIKESRYNSDGHCYCYKEYKYVYK